MSDVFKKLEKAKEKLQQAKQSQAVFEDRIATAEAELKKLGYDSVEDAQKDLEKIDATIGEMELTLEGMINDFDKKYSNLMA